MDSHNEASSEFIVKNTFLDLQDLQDLPLKPRRKCSSLPPSCRYGNTPTSKKEHQASDFSTDDSTGAYEADGTSSEVTSLTETEGNSVNGNSFTNPVPPSGSSSLQMGRSPLSSKAKAWQPVLSPFSLEYKFGQEAAHVVTSAKTALENYVRKVDIEAGSHGWAIFIWTKVDNAKDNETLLNIAKDTLLKGAAKSTCAYMLGYGQKPMISQPHGFMATLCAMHDESRACWDTYLKGFCPFKSTCKKVHPKCLVPIHVVVHKEGNSLTGPVDRDLVKKQFLGSRQRTSLEHMDMLEKIYTDSCPMAHKYLSG